MLIQKGTQIRVHQDRIGRLQIDAALTRLLQLRCRRHLLVRPPLRLVLEERSWLSRVVAIFRKSPYKCYFGEAKVGNGGEHLTHPRRFLGSGGLQRFTVTASQRSHRSGSCSCCWWCISRRSWTGNRPCLSPVHTISTHVDPGHCSSQSVCVVMFRGSDFDGSSCRANNWYSLWHISTGR